MGDSRLDSVDEFEMGKALRNVGLNLDGSSLTCSLACKWLVARV
jgi:hypothetical protein